jgi:hypothetical protein
MIWARKKAPVIPQEVSMTRRIAFTIAILALSASAAVAAPATQPAATSAHKTHASTAMRNDASADRETKALNLLEAKGYGSFANFKSDGKDYAATVTEAGHNMTVRVDPDNGQITTQS